MLALKRKWHKVAVSTKPINWFKAKKQVEKVYQFAGLKPPKEYIYCSSPLSANIMMNQFCKKTEEVREIQKKIYAAERIVKNNIVDKIKPELNNFMDGFYCDRIRAATFNTKWLITERIAEEMDKRKFNLIFPTFDGQFGAGYAAFWDYFKEPNPIADLIRNSGFVYLLKDIAFICDRPSVINTDLKGRPHSEDRPAILYRDGFSIYAWHGMAVEEKYALNPDTIILDDILNEYNSTKRYTLIELYGRERFLSHCELLQSDDWGNLYRYEDFHFAKMVNPEREPEGAYLDYIFQVEPEVKTAREAVQNTFGQLKKLLPY